MAGINQSNSNYYTKLDNNSTGLRARNLVKSFSNKKVVRDVSFDIQRGETVGLLGPNGAGKTTSFYLTTGLILPNSGSVWIDEFEITNLPVYQRTRLGLGYLPQEGSIFKGLTVRGNLTAIAEFYIPNRGERTQMVDELINEFDLKHIENSPATSLSGGERRRVEIARALVPNPQFLLLDEPFAGVDPIAVEGVRELIQRLNKRNIGVLLTDHNVHAALPMLDRVFIVHNGAILANGSPKEITHNQEVRQLYLGEKF